MPIPAASAIVPYVAPAAAAKLSLLTKALIGGTAVTAIPGLMGLPRQIEKGILDNEPDADGEYNVNPLIRAIGGERFSQEALTAKGQKRTQKDLQRNDPAVAAREQLLGDDPIKLGETRNSYLTRTSEAARRKKESNRTADFMSDPYQIQSTRIEQRDANRRHDEKMEALDIRRTGIEGDIASNNLSLRIAQDANKERMFTYRQDLQAKRENDRYKTTAGLISGLGALGAAFAL